MMNDSVAAALAIMLVFALCGASYAFGRITVADDCENYGKSKVEIRMLECRVIKEGKP